MNRKRHLGLQQLSSLASVVKTFLGPIKSSKFIVDKRTYGSVLICSVVRLLESLDSNNTVGQLLNDTIQAQNKEYKTGTTTLLFLVSAWSSAVLECLEQGVPLSIIVTLMSEGLNSCIEQVQCLTISIQDVTQKLDDIPMKCNKKVLIRICFGTTGRQIIETKTLGMSESYSCVCPGYVMSLCPEKAAIAKQLQDRPLDIVLIAGDLTDTYRHLGFNRSQNVRMVLESGNKRIAQFRGKMLVTYVQGNICESLEEKCFLHNILIINQVTHAVLQAFSNITGAEIVTYLAQVNEHCVGKDVYLNYWGTGESSWRELDSRVPIVITAKGIHLVTVVLSSPILSKMQATEDNFWTCAYCVHHALLDNAVFPGSGVVELLCLSYLEKLGKEVKSSTKEFHTDNQK
ncbi:PREDICTED: Bardet-Biedl syndrome 12 protein [Gekko japonicus]|uniref:Bardet-Biedl syndrome 12 protein n=1 Tax=Gekko japonicus TaxID=146911 RepID=A0ABM1JW67_GEKJA|nr:PREDICTED: Bardet-Biedl syndrome 12 protein [Gekko japonicus]